MNHQLHLIVTEERATWRLDAETREVGRKGLAQARAALLSARTAPERPPRSPVAATSHSHVRAQQRRSAA